MKVNSRKITIILLTIACFWVAYARLHEFYIETIPLGKEGSCYSIKYPQLNGRYQMKILENDNQDKSSKVEISLLNKPIETWHEDFSYFEQRMLDPQHMECM